MEQQSYLSGFNLNPVLASPGKRFLNDLIDNAFLFVLVFLCMYVFVIVQEFLGPLIIYALYAIYFALSEILFNGRIIGKFITGTKAVNKDGTKAEPFSAWEILRGHGMINGQELA